MASTCEELVAFAESIDKSMGEAAWRAAVSRAYYGAYHRSVQWEKLLPALGSNSGTAGGVHQQLINRLQNPAPECGGERMKSRSLAYRLAQLKVLRTSADYDLISSMTEEQTVSAIVNAKQLLADFPA